jgi:hypothetical protein
MMPVRNTPSNVPAPPMLAIGAPSLGMLSRLDRSAPMSVPRTPDTYAITLGAPEGRMYASRAATRGGMKTGVLMPTPFTGLATR